jgi:hypothetical protein
MTPYKESAMNKTVISAECAHEFCHECAYEDCAHECHLPDDFEDPLNEKCERGGTELFHARIVRPRCLARPTGENPRMF